MRPKSVSNACTWLFPEVQPFAPVDEDLAISAADLTLAVDQHGRVVLVVIGLFANRTDDVHVMLLRHFRHGAGRGTRDRFCRRAGELFGQAGDIHALAAGRLQVLETQFQLRVAFASKADADGRHLHASAGQFDAYSHRRWFELREPGQPWRSAG